MIKKKKKFPMRKKIFNPYCPKTFHFWERKKEEKKNREVRCGTYHSEKKFFNFSFVSPRHPLSLSHTRVLSVSNASHIVDPTPSSL